MQDEKVKFIRVKGKVIPIKKKKGSSSNSPIKKPVASKKQREIMALRKAIRVSIRDKTGKERFRDGANKGIKLGILGGFSGLVIDSATTGKASKLGIFTGAIGLAAGAIMGSKKARVTDRDKFNEAFKKNLAEGV